MKKSHVWLGLCLLLALAAFKQDSVAQAAPANEVMAGAGLAEAAEKARDALNDSDYKSLHEMLDAPVRGQLALLQEKFIYALEELKVSDESAMDLAKSQDPRGTLGISDVAGLRALGETDFFGFISGMLARASSRDAGNAALRWHLVAKGVGVVDSRNKYLRRMDLLNWVGAVTFANRANETISVQFSVDGQAWKLAYYSIDAADRSGDLDLGRLLEFIDKWDKDTFKWPAATRARMKEAEQYLGSARDFLRVTYSKTGEESEVNKPFEDEIATGAFDGESYVIRKCHPGLTISEYDAAVEAHPTNAADPWGLITFKWASGASKVEWFDTKADLDARVTKLKEEKEDAPAKERKFR
jgi:hypothetical protein